MDTALHIHTENSLKECGVKIDDALRRAAELGYRKVVLGDACNMTGAVEFCNKAAKHGITPVLGVECFFEEGSKILLVAKNREGYVTLCRLVTGANSNLTPAGRPTVTEEMLKETDTSELIACCGGTGSYAAYPYQRNKEYIRLSASAPPAVEAEAPDLSETKARLLEIREALKEKRAAKKVFQHKLKVCGSMAEERTGETGGSEEGLKESLDKVTKEIERFVKLEKTAKKQIDAHAKKEKKAAEAQAKWEEMKSKILDADALSAEIEGRLAALQGLFGSLAVEVTAHGQKEEQEINRLLLQVAGRLGIQTVLSFDSYTLDGSEEEVLKWHLVRSLQDNTWVPMDASSAFYGIEREEELLARSGLTPEIFCQLSANTDALFQDCGMVFDKSDHYPKYPVPEGTTPTHLMEERARAAIPKLYRDGSWTKAHEEKLKNEIEVIDKTGYSDYTLTIADILNKARAMADPEVVSCLVGPGRGSGAGSIVNYLMGITSVDPVQYGLIFERYLNIERDSPPDIDSDIATSIRDGLVQRIKQDYGKKEGSVGVCGILTKSRLAGKAAIRAAGRLLSSRKYGNTTALYGLADRMAKLLPMDPKLKLADHIKELEDTFRDGEAREILHYARLLEGALQAYGTHAAGVIISDSGDITDYAPLINLGTKEEPVWNVQYDMVESESIGFLKLDMLGLSTLDVCYTALRLIRKRHGKKIDLYHVPFEKEVFQEIYVKGATDGVFQCESAGMKRMWMDLKPSCIEDIIAGIALYRPGPMEFIPDYIRGKENPQSIHYKTEKLRPILESTYGCIVFQEQVMRIVRDLAGYSMGRSDLVRRAMSKKKEDVMAQERKNFVYGNEKEGIPGCVQNGISAGVADSIYDDMVDFAKYAFNKSHAAAYALVSYQTAWLKYHYPLEFMVGAMDVAARQNAPDKLPGLLHECRRMGIEVLPPDVNLSKEGFSILDGKLLYGLWAVKGVKEKAPEVIANRHPIYRSFKEFLLSCKANKTAIRNLVKAGAFTQLHASRTGILLSLEELLAMRGKIWKLKEKVDGCQAALEDTGLDAKKQRLAEAKLYNAQTELHAQEEAFHEFTIPMIADPVDKKLEYEKETLFSYITAHPLDAYDEKPSCVCMGDISVNDVGAKGVEGMGCITNFREVRRKKDGKVMAVFTLQDRTGEQKCICYAAKYAEYKDVLQDGRVVHLFFNVNADRDDAEQVLLTVHFAKMLIPDLGPILYSIEEGGEAKAMEEVKPYLTEQGHPLLWHIKNGERAGQLIQTGLFVSREITSQFPGDTVQEAEYIKKRRR